MDLETRKAEFSGRMSAARATWEALLDEVGKERMETPGVEGHWTVKDIVAHVAEYEQDVVDKLRAAAADIDPGQSIIPPGDIDSRNAVMYERDRERSLDEVLASSQQVYADLVAAVDALPAAALFDAQRFAWRKGHSLEDYVEGNGFGHYDEHIPEIRGWLDRQEVSAAGE